MQKVDEKNIEEMEETVLRLHVYLKRLYEENNGFKDLHKMIEKRFKISFKKNGKIREQLNNYHEYSYYQGKIYAYIYSLQSLKRNEVPNLISRLRGIVVDKRGAKAVETKYILSIDKVGP